ncbi:MAG: hypothetical protein RL137_1255 [Bacteroidota bacterium]
MKTIFFTLYCLAIALQLKAQIIQTEPDQYEGQNTRQKDIDSLFQSNPNITWLELHYVDSTLQLPSFKALGIFSLHSETLRELTFKDSLPELELIDLTTPELRIFNEIPLPNLFQLTIKAQLDSLPNFICTAPELRLVDIKNYKDIMWPDCMEERFVNGPFELSSCEILDAKDGNTISKIVSPDNVNDEWLETSDDLSQEELEELQKDIKKSARRITIFKRSLGFVLASIFFLIWVG